MISQSAEFRAVIASVRARRIDDITRALMTGGIELSFDEADEIGEEGIHWMRTRLGLVMRSSDVGVIFEERKVVCE